MPSFPSHGHISPKHDERPCVEFTSGEARYLLSIFDSSHDGSELSQAELARRLGVSGPTTLQMVRRLRELGLVKPDGLALTSAGMSAALGLGHRRAAARVLTSQVLGIDENQADDEARRLAPSISPSLARRLVSWQRSHKDGS